MFLQCKDLAEKLLCSGLPNQLASAHLSFFEQLREIGKNNYKISQFLSFLNKRMHYDKNCNPLETNFRRVNGIVSDH